MNLDPSSPATPPIVPPPLSSQPRMPPPTTFIYRGKPRVWPLWLALATHIGGILMCWIVAFIVWFIVHPPPTSRDDRAVHASVERAIVNPAMLLPVLLGIDAVTAGIALAAGALSPIGLRRRLALRPGTAGYGTIALLCIGTIGVGMFGSAVAHLIMGGEETKGILPKIIGTTAASGPIGFLTVLTLLSLLPGTCEELLFRGYVQTRFVRRWGAAAGIMITGVMFGLAHMDKVQSPLTMLLGFYLGWVAHRTGSTRPAMVCHIVNNAWFVVIVTIGSILSPKNAGSQVRSGEPNYTLALILIGVGLSAVILCTLAAQRRLPPAPTPDTEPDLPPPLPPPMPMPPNAAQGFTGESPAPPPLPPLP